MSSRRRWLMAEEAWWCDTAMIETGDWVKTGSVKVDLGSQVSSSSVESIEQSQLSGHKIQARDAEHCHSDRGKVNRGAWSRATSLYRYAGMEGIGCSRWHCRHGPRGSRVRTGVHAYAQLGLQTTRVCYSSSVPLGFSPTRGAHTKSLV
jgi:hypothetical protein